MKNEIIFRKAQDSDWKKYKDIRLAALLYSPDAFGSSYEKESKLTDDDWKNFLKKGSNFYFAFDKGQPVGLIGYFTKSDQPDSRYIFSMWVHFEYRNKSIGQILVENVILAATQEDAHSLITGYASSNSRAKDFYIKLGFTETGRSIPLERDPHVQEIEMIKIIQEN